MAEPASMINTNFTDVWPDTNKASGPLGADNPGQQTCPNCRSSVTPYPTNGVRVAADGGNAGKADAIATSAGYSCPKCGHSFSWTKSTGKAGGPQTVDNTNMNTAADM